MSDEIVAEVPVAAPDNAAALPETAANAAPGNAGDAGAPENVEEETDEQKNERVQREAGEAAAKRADKQSRGVQKRIDELTADKHAERKRADELASQNARILALLEGKSGSPGGPAKASDDAPTREQFGSYEEYLRADARYEARREAKELIESSTKAQREAQAKTAAERAVIESRRSYATREAEIASKIPDYFEVMEDANVSIPTKAYDLIQKMADGPLIAYHIAKQPDLAKQFWQNADDPAMHGIILGQLSATLKATPSKISNAPAPGKTVRSQPASSDAPPTDPKHYIAWANKHLK